MPGLQKNQRCKAVLLGACLGALTFLLVYGPGPLDVTNDAWIWACYDYMDLVQNYTGDMALRNSAWHFPLGQADTLACYMPEGVNIAFTDSMPLLAILVKPFASLLPATFQYRGLYIFLAFILQGASAALLLSLFLESLSCIGLGTLFFTVSPLLHDRAFRHNSLSSHFFILFALYFYFRHRREQKLPWAFLVLSALSTGITPYFLPMLAIFALLIAAEHMRSTRRCAIPLCFFAANCAAGMGTAWIIGSVGNGYSAARDGYGYYSMNLNALINPTSIASVLSGYRYSRILGVRPLLYGQIDGFCYFGVGALVLLALGIVLFVGLHRTKAQWRQWLHGNGLLLAACVFLTAFAVSHLVAWDDKQLFTVPLPGRLLALAAIFRSSSRMFWPVYYLLLLFGIVMAARGLANSRLRRAFPAVLAVLLALQCFDLSEAFHARHVLMEQAVHAEIEIPAEFTGSRFKMLYMTPGFAQNRMVIALSQKLGLRTNGYNLNTEPENIWVEQNRDWEILDALDSGAMQGALDPTTLYGTSDTERVALWRELYSDEADFILWEKPSGIPDIYWTDEVWFMVPREAETG